MRLLLFILFFPFASYGQESIKKASTQETVTKESTQVKKPPQEETKKEPAQDKKQKSKESKNGAKKEEEPLPIGNFALPTSQQPAPLVSFGQLIIGKDVLQLYFMPFFFLGNDFYTTAVLTSMLYGITDDLVATIGVPVSPGNKNRNHHSSGLEDIFLGLEYAFYSTKSKCSTNQATVLAEVIFPSGNPRVDPPTGFGSPSFFIGGTFNHMTTIWAFFFSSGAFLTTQNDGIKFG